jgi:cation diffusion facilitator family transporter
MHSHSLEQWQHDHDFHLDSSHGERRTRYVVLLTAVMMVVEIAAGYLYGSMALLADGWHMGTHVAALGISLFAYGYARRHADDPRYSFGTGKVSSLAGFASAVALAVVALMMGAESVQRLLSPQTIHFDEAILVASVGLAVNLLSAWLLRDDHSHHHHGHDEPHHHHDHNLRAAYLHVLADALTSLLAIVALLCGRALGWVWMDALMGIVGALVIAKWGLDLIRETGGVLLDGTYRRLAPVANRPQPLRRHRRPGHSPPPGSRILQGPGAGPARAGPCHRGGEPVCRRAMYLTKIPQCADAILPLAMSRSSC